MTRYYLHLTGPETVFYDEHGVELRSIEEANRIAVEWIRELLLEDALAGKSPSATLLQIADEHGAVLKSLPFRVAMHG